MIMDELLKLTKENNEMLKYLIRYVNHEMTDGQVNDFMMNVLANQFNMKGVGI